jgi:hypothetical protein
MNTDYCSCKNLICQYHPSKHDKGCIPCVKICLKDSAIPSCFFRAVSEELRDVEVIPDSSYETFAKLILKEK